MISKKTTITTMIALTALALVTAPSVLTLGSVYAFNLGNLFGNGGSGNDGFGNLLGGVDNLIKNVKDLGKSDGKSSDSGKAPDTGKDSTDNNQPCKVDNSQKGTHFYCTTPSGGNSHHHCKPGPDNPGCKKFK